MPPPNANGNLHIGHALTDAVEDIAIRYHRMKGERRLYYRAPTTPALKPKWYTKNS